MLAPFFASLLAGLKWLVMAAVPVMLSSFVIGLLVKAGVTITSFFVIVWGAEYLRDYAIDQIAVLGAGAAGAAVLQILSLFGIFEGLSLVVSTLLAKASWLAIKPSLTWITPPSGGA